MISSLRKIHSFIALSTLFLLLLGSQAIGRSLEERCNHGDQEACHQLRRMQESGGSLEERCNRGDQEACHQLRRMQESGGNLEERCNRGDQEACRRLRHL